MLLLINAKSHSITIEVNVISRGLGSNSLLLALRSVGRDGLRFIINPLGSRPIGFAVFLSGDLYRMAIIAHLHATPEIKKGSVAGVACIHSCVLLVIKEDTLVTCHVKDGLSRPV